MKSWLDNIQLNEQQLKAVTYGDGPLYVVAGAGTGKTKTLTTRIIYLIKEKKISPNRILALTFTNKAAREIRQRVNQNIYPESMGSWLYTFHAFCLRILRDEAHLLDYKNDFDVIDEEDAKKIIRDIIKEHNVDHKKYPVRVVRGKISNKKTREFVEMDDVEVMIYHYYQAYLKKDDLMDFDDLIVNMLTILETFPNSREKIQDYFDHILVDEYQDTDKLQYKILFLLAMKRKNLFIVGDPDQSIYRFRGANYGNSQAFIQDFEAVSIVLDKNYRSTNNILNAANKLIAHNVNRTQAKKLQSDFPMGQSIKIFEGQNDFYEAQDITNHIEALTKIGYRYDDIAILYRNNALSRGFEDNFIRNEIPYVIYGGISFYERKEIKDMLAYVKVVLNPHLDHYIKRIINEPRRNIGKTTIDKIVAQQETTNVSFYDALDEAPLSGKTKESLKAFKTLIIQLREKIEQVSSLKEIIKIIYVDSGYEAMLKQENDDIAKDRIDNIFELMSVFANGDFFYEGDTLHKLSQLLDQIALYSDLDKEEKESNSVKLSTFHQVKGLEFKVVFMVAMEEGIFPNERTYLDLAELEEERRVCYVGITRAKERLILSYAKQRMLYGSIKYQKPSRFIFEIQAKREEKTKTPPYTKDKNQSNHQVLNPGDKVVHQVFENGVVVSVADDIATIAFKYPHGIKKIQVFHPAIKKMKE